MDSTAERVTALTDLQAAYDGSFYTICGAGGDLMEWVDGVEDLLAQAGIGKPACWFQTTGQHVNEYAEPKNWRDAFPPDLVILMFPLEGLATSKLAIFRLMMVDRWFDDIVDNMRAGR